MIRKSVRQQTVRLSNIRNNNSLAGWPSNNHIIEQIVNTCYNTSFCRIGVFSMTICDKLPHTMLFWACCEHHRHWSACFSENIIISYTGCTACIYTHTNICKCIYIYIAVVGRKSPYKKNLNTSLVVRSFREERLWLVTVRIHASRKEKR